MEVEEKYWGITQFTDQVNARCNSKRHYNTIDTWFKSLEEEKKLHYIQRLEETQEKIYDQTDLEIACYIHSRRLENWSLSAIFADLPNRFELRLFPDTEPSVNSEAPVMDIAAFRKEMLQTFNQVLEEKLAETKRDIVQELLDSSGMIAEKAKNEIVGLLPEDPNKAMEQMKKEIIQAIPQQPDPAEERQKRITEMITQKRIEYALREEALSVWNVLPESERLIKSGWFRKTEDAGKKEAFIREYIHQHFEDRLLEEYDMVEKK